ncbi:zinc finger FYVE domain-containing protein 9-like isoform X2 [Liolophura sinensis]|uniref:zinc finger FYVE domain-containing protein 9-like isoform X2 n=1 Tax=Liolophura sinensis TaxID=3198878 RepID=UPI00315824AB
MDTSSLLSEDSGLQNSVEQTETSSTSAIPSSVNSAGIDPENVPKPDHLLEVALGAPSAEGLVSASPRAQLSQAPKANCPGVKPKEPQRLKRPSSLLGLSTVSLQPVINVPKSQSLPRSFALGATDSRNIVKKVNKTLESVPTNSCQDFTSNVSDSSALMDDSVDTAQAVAVENSETVVGNSVAEVMPQLSIMPEEAVCDLKVLKGNMLCKRLFPEKDNTKHGELPPGAGPHEVSSISREGRPESLNLPRSWGSPVTYLIQNTMERSQQGRITHSSDSSDGPPSYLDLEDSGSEGGAVGGAPANPRTSLGSVAPKWVPDAEAPNCMQCDSRFTFTKRRHHCRACGKVFCSTCCNLKCKLEYMGSKEARVCVACHEAIVTGSQRRGEPKQVMFSDGIRPGGDLTEADGVTEARLPQRSGRKVHKVERMSAASGEGQSAGSRMKPVKVTESSRWSSLIPAVGLPPLVMPDSTSQDDAIYTNPTDEKVMQQIQSESAEPVVFMINPNLQCRVTMVNLDCCVHRQCWCFTSKGLCTVGQDEVVIVLECLQDEITLPMDIFHHLQSLYESASKGNTVSDMGHTIFCQSFLGSKDHGGFLYIRPSFQCLLKLSLPSPPYVFAILLQKWEIPWAKVFPIRLLLRLGAEYRYYPCPLISIRNRKPVFFEIGHTIMNLLADFRSYQYMLPQVKGLLIHMEDKKTVINFPRNRYQDLMKVVNGSNEHVMALGANFSMEADSHLVCIQNDDGNYQTQAINIQNKPRKVTGASFVVFNGALKTASGLTAKSSIVEDGLMVQIPPDSMAALKQSIKDMKNYSIACGSVGSAKPDEVITIQWVEDDRTVNVGVKSPVDNMSMDGIESLHIHNGTDYLGENRVIRWTEVFFIQNKDSAKLEPIDLSRLAESLAQAGCIALTPHLDQLNGAGLNKIGLRATIHSDSVGYEVGSNGEKLPDMYMNDLDNELIPVIHNAASLNQEGPITLELIFYILN